MAASAFRRAPTDDVVVQEQTHVSVIQRVEARAVAYPPGPIHREMWGEKQQQAALISVVDEDGRAGHALARCHYRTTAATIIEYVEHSLGPLIVGERTQEHARLWETMMRWSNGQYVPTFPISALDVALWDLRGQETGLPIAKMLSPTAADTVRAYASIPVIPSPEGSADSAQEAFEAGFTGVKLHAPTASLDLGLEQVIVAAVRERCPLDAMLMYDAVKILTREQALALGRSLQAASYAWFEEPFGPFASEDYRWLRSQLDIPLAGFETAPGGPEAFRWAIDQRIVDIAEVDCYWKGGITGAWRAVEIAGSCGQSLAMHHGGSSSMNLAGIHLAASTPLLGMVELLTPVDSYNVGQSLPGLDATTKTISVPTGPGLGHEIDWDFFHEHQQTATVTIAA